MRSLIRSNRRHFITMSVTTGLISIILVMSLNTVAARSKTVVQKALGQKGGKRVDWRLEKTTGEKPAPRGGGKLIAIGNKLVQFGGFMECFDKSKCDHTYYNDIYILDISTNVWEKRAPVSPNGELPDKRAFFGGAAYGKKNTAVFWGGSQYNANLTSVKVYDDMWEYDPQTNKIWKRTYANQGPSARLGGEIVIKDDTLYLFGGYDKNFKAHNELWSYDLVSNTWKQLRADDDPKSPSKRYIFRFELSESGDDIYIFGGNYRETVTIQRNDLWRYNIPTDTFVEVVSEKGTNITGRTHGSAATFGDYYLIALGDIPSGGCYTNQASEHQNPTNEVWMLRAGGTNPESKWSQVKIGSTPVPLKRIMYAKAANRLYVTGGFTFKCDKTGPEGAVYNVNTYSLPLKEMQ